MGILKSAADLVYTIRFLKLLSTPIEETEAFKAGIIDDKANRIKSFDRNILANRQAYDEHYTTFHRLVYNLKKIMAKAPGGNSVLARYGAALALIKEHGELSNANVEKIHNQTQIDNVDILAEQNQWYVLPDQSLSPGIYRMRNESITTSFADVIRTGDQIRIQQDNNKPVDEILGISIYEAVHLNSNQTVLVSSAELTK